MHAEVMPAHREPTMTPRNAIYSSYLSGSSGSPGRQNLSTANNAIHQAQQKKLGQCSCQIVVVTVYNSDTVDQTVVFDLDSRVTGPMKVPTGECRTFHFTVAAGKYLKAQASVGSNKLWVTGYFTNLA